MNAPVKCTQSAHLQVPVYVRALGDEVRALEKYLGLGLLTQEEAQERLGEWELFYPPGWHRITSLVEARQSKPLPKHERNVRPWDMADARTVSGDTVDGRPPND